MKIIPRPHYINKIVSRLNRDMMLILVGQRRVGKSFILRLIHEWIVDNIPDSNVIYINKELHIFGQIRTADDLYTYVDEKIKAGSSNYLLIDEVQDIEDYETALRSLHAEDRCQIIATGSNAYIFSSELSTRLAGRYIEVPIYSLTYVEFLKFKNLEDSEENLLKFLKVGGLPGLLHFDINDDGQLRDYMQGVYNTVMMRDVLTREMVRNVAFIENLTRYIADNIGKLTSFGNISNFVASKGESVSYQLVSSYMGYLCKALIIDEVKRYDLKGKRILENNCKYYFTDHGLRNFLCGFNLRGSIEKILENVVYNQLLFWDYDIKVGMLRAGEIDFVVTKDGRKCYIQVCYLLSSEETIKREFGTLKSINDDYPKYVISMDPLGGELPEYPGIRHLPLRRFLLDGLLIR